MAEARPNSRCRSIRKRFYTKPKIGDNLQLFSDSVVRTSETETQPTGVLSERNLDR